MMMKTSFFLYSSSLSTHFQRVFFFHEKRLCSRFALNQLRLSRKKEKKCFISFFFKKCSGRCASNIWVRLSLISNGGVVVVTIFFSFLSVRYNIKLHSIAQFKRSYNKKRLFSFLFTTFWMFAAVCGGWTSCVVLLLSHFEFPILRAFFFLLLWGWNFNPFWKSEKKGPIRTVKRIFWAVVKMPDGR